MDKPVFFCEFFRFKRFSTLIICMHAWNNTTPRNAHMRHFTHGDRRSISKKSCNFLVTAPIRTFNGIGKMHIGAIALTHSRVTKCSLHATHGSRRMRTLWRNKGKTNNIEASFSSFYSHSFTRKPSSHAQKISFKYTHDNSLNSYEVETDYGHNTKSNVKSDE